MSKFSAHHPFSRRIDKTVVIWLGPIDDKSSISQLHSIVNSIRMFEDVDQCAKFLNEIKNEKAFIVISNMINQHLKPLFHSFSQVHSTYILCNNKHGGNPAGTYSRIEDICHSLKQDIRRYETEQSSISILSSDRIPNHDINELDQSYMYSQLLKEAILEIEFDDEARKRFADFCCFHYSDNKCKVDAIRQFENDYERHSPIWWYTKELFIYSMLNQALRTQYSEIVIRMGFFMQDLHRQIEDLHAKIPKDEYPRIVYRGQGVSDEDFDKLKNTNGGLISFNNFLSTSLDPTVARAYAESSKGNLATQSILFRIELDPLIASAPFVELKNIGYYQEEKEILFSMHAVFRVGCICQIDDRLWEVQLTSTSSTDEKLVALTNYIRNELQQSIGWNKLGHLMIKIGKFNQAREIYHQLFHLISNKDWKGRALIYSYFGLIHKEKGENNKALSFYNRSIQIFEKYFFHDYQNRAINYGNIGEVYRNMGKYPDSLSYYQKALELQNLFLPYDHPYRGIIYNDIALVYSQLGDEINALSYFQQTLQNQEKCLPSNHPHVSITYSNIGQLYQLKGEYPVALSFYQKALENEEKSLPSDHPCVAITSNCIGVLYRLIGDYPKALWFSEKALSIQQKSLKYNHPNTAIIYINIGEVN
ncbi:unnamed protein product [Rotaria sp. Silwood2]|nr:unnamed protein product [Rotaria sp. Silwood2]CAF4541888.1 unnamed protein product [Rotaria sp. Silwood2]